MTTLSELQASDELGFLWEALDAIASPTIRNMATVGGNLFVKQPYGDLAACLIALGATASISGPSGERSEPVEKTVAATLGRGEIVTSVSLRVAGGRHVQVPQGGAQGVQLGGDRHRRGSCLGRAAARSRNAASALGGVAASAIRAPSVEKALIGKPLDRASVEAAAARGAPRHLACPTTPMPAPGTAPA